MSKSFDECKNKGISIQDHGPTSFLSHPSVFDWVKRVYGFGGDTESFKFDIVEAYACYQHGLKTFRFSRNLSEQLIATDFSVRAGDIKLPFPAFTMSFDLPGVSLEGEDLDQFNLNCASVFWCGPILREEKLPIKFIIKNLCIVVHSFEENGIGADQASRFIDFDNVKDDQEINIESLRDLSIYKGKDNHELIMRMVFNSILYITSYGADVKDMRSPADPEISAMSRLKSSSKRAKIERRIEHLSRLPYVLVGGSIKIPTQRIDHGGTGHKLKNRHVVRGHWKWQPYGEGRALRRHTWIAPYIQGPEGAPILSRGYMVSMDGES